VTTSHHVVAVASGKGGVGKSTVTTNLAAALAQQGLAVGLLDADIYGPSQQLMLGVPESTIPDQRDGEYLLPVEAHGLKTMSMGYLSSANTPMVWRGPMASSAMAQLLEKTLWGDLDVLLVDMPPGTGDIQLTLAQRATLTGAVIVTTPQDIALLDARKGIEMFQKVEVPVLGLIENMSAHVCTECGHVEPLFGEAGGNCWHSVTTCRYWLRSLSTKPSANTQTPGGLLYWRSQTAQLLKSTATPQHN